MNENWNDTILNCFERISNIILWISIVLDLVMISGKHKYWLLLNKGFLVKFRIKIIDTIWSPWTHNFFLSSDMPYLVTYWNLWAGLQKWPFIRELSSLPSGYRRTHSGQISIISNSLLWNNVSFKLLIIKWDQEICILMLFNTRSICLHIF